ncbi:hypothetical protein D3C72_1201460 [compost metagenome]
MLARLGAALGHLGREHRRVGGDQRADAVALAARQHQLAHQPRHARPRHGRHQAVEQLADAQHALAQLAQPEHQADRDAVVFQVRVDRRGAGAAGVEPVAEGHEGGLQRFFVARQGEHLLAQRVQVGHEGVERARLARFGADAQPQLGRKARRHHLAAAVGDGVHHRVAPARRAVGHGRGVGQQRADARELGVVEQRDPAGVEHAGQHQPEQVRGVGGLGRARQDLAAHAFAELAQEGGARRKAVVGQQRREVDRLRERAPPGAQPLAQLGACLDGVEQQLHAADGGLRRGAVAAQPVEEVDEPDVALRHIGRGVEAGKQPLQVARCSSHDEFVTDQCGEHRGTGSAGPLVLPPARGLEKRHDVREAWGST